MLQHVDTVLAFAVVMLLLSLLVTTIVQVVLARLGLRTQILKWGIERLLKQVDSSLTPEQVSRIAEEVLNHPALNRPKGKPPTAISKDALIRLLDNLATSDKSPLPSDVKPQLSRVLGVAASTQMAEAGRKLKIELEAAFPDQLELVRNAVDRATEDTRKIVGDLGAWFDMVMDRTTELFLQRTRFITIIVAAALALLFQVDSLAILRQLASDAELRAEWVEYGKTATQLAQANFAQVAAQKGLGTSAIKAAWAQVKDEIEGPNTLPEVPEDLTTRADGETWLADALKDSESRTMVIDAYGEQFDRLSTALAEELYKPAGKIIDRLQESELTVFHDPVDAWCSTYWEDGMHFVGVVLTVLFLSLGAPFWYNALRQLSDLRPVLAEKIDPKGRGKK